MRRARRSMRARPQVRQQSTKIRCPDREPRLCWLTPLSSRTLNHLADRFRAHRRQHRSRWRRLAPGRHPDPDRPGGGPEAPLLRQTRAPRGERAGHRRPGRPARVDLTGAARLDPRLTAARTHGIIDALTSADVMTCADKGYQGRPGQRTHTVQAASLPPEAVKPAEDGQPGPREDPCSWRTRHRHAQDLEDPGQAALLPSPRHHDRAGHPRPAPHRNQPLRRMKMAQRRQRRPERCRGQGYRSAGSPATRRQCAIAARGVGRVRVIGTGPTAKSSGHSEQDEWAGAVAGVMSVGGGDVGEAVELVRADGGRD